MAYQGEFDQASKITFNEKKGKPFNRARIQAGMFMDRPDLWQKPKRRRRRRVRPGQKELF